MKSKFSDLVHEFILIFVLFIMPFLGLVAIPNVYIWNILHGENNHHHQINDLEKTKLNIQD